MLEIPRFIVLAFKMNPRVTPTFFVKLGFDGMLVFPEISKMASWTMLEIPRFRVFRFEMNCFPVLFGDVSLLFAFQVTTQSISFVKLQQELRKNNSSFSFAKHKPEFHFCKVKSLSFVFGVSL